MFSLKHWLLHFNAFNPSVRSPQNHMAMRRRTLIGGVVAALSVVGASAGIAAQPYDDPDRMYDALLAGPADIIRVGGGRLRIVFADDAPGLHRQRVLGWIRRNAIAVSTYFGRYPVREHGILVFADRGARVSHGVTYGYRGPATQVSVGMDADETTLARDWVMAHEMVHTALPILPRRALWLQEGNATYVEPLARAQAGQLPAEEVWLETFAGMPHGLAPPAAGGMDGTHAWGRLYWGGALFWLQAEIALYRRSGGTRTLRQALRAINRSSGGNGAMWTPEHMMRVADDAMGNTVMSSLYAQFAAISMPVDLAKEFAQLGVVAGPDKRLRFDDHAPLAALRRRMTQA